MIQLVKNKQWLMPYEDCDMKALCSLNIRLTKFDIDFLPTLKLIADYSNKQIEVLDFNETVFDPTLTKLEKFWTKTEKNIIRYEKNRIKLLGPNTPSNIKKLKNIENKFAYFFERWAYDVEFIPNQSKTKCGLTIDYVPCNDKLPVITLGEAEHDIDFEPAILELGEYRILLNKRTNGFGFQFQHLENNNWEDVKTVSNMPYSKLGSNHFVSVLFELMNLRSIK